PLHAIEVDEEEQQFFFLPAREIEVRRSLFEQAATVEQTSKIVFQRTVAERFFDLLALGDVAYDLDQTTTIDARNRNLEWQRVAIEPKSDRFTAPRTVAPDGRHDLFFQTHQFIFEVEHLPACADQSFRVRITENLRVRVVQINADTAVVDDGHAIHRGFHRGSLLGERAGGALALGDIASNDGSAGDCLSIHDRRDR